MAISMSMGANEQRRMADLMPPLQSVRDALAVEALRQKEKLNDPAFTRNQRARALFWASGFESLVYRFDNALHNLARTADSPVSGRIVSEFIDFRRWIFDLAENDSRPEVIVKVVQQVMSDMVNLEGVDGWSDSSGPLAGGAASNTEKLPPNPTGGEDNS
ncbi:hypothetical protein [Azohydromonas caseinilytica]|uniref:Uncharacterized protein n=1 Tax=Azohydromonas caseinilytica TaxID=2728836 RepID=A0A848FCA0_9BURK|nr:hypothetical protein [Azohydromonas caseinilytica]NML17104.1 hypothetical protein [Azohydromonas caseinilytica]